MTTTKLVAGATSTWSSLMTTELGNGSGLVSGNAVQGGTAIDNGTNNDLMAEFSFVGGGSITPTGSPFFALYIYPKNGDNSTFGDGRFGSSATGIPPSNYYKGFCGLPAAAGTQTGTFARPGSSIFQIALPRGIWVPVFYNGCGVTLTSTGNILYYRTTNLSIA